MVSGSMQIYTFIEGVHAQTTGARGEREDMRERRREEGKRHIIGEVRTEGVQRHICGEMEKVRDQELYRDAQLEKGERREKKTIQHVEKEEIRDK